MLDDHYPAGQMTRAEARKEFDLWLNRPVDQVEAEEYDRDHVPGVEADPTDAWGPVYEVTP